MNADSVNEIYNNERIQSILEQLGVEFEAEKSFPGLIGTGETLKSNKLRFDFYLPRTAKQAELLLEFQGCQHYATGYGLHTEFKDLKRLRQQEYDARKRRFCDEKNIPLLEIPPGLTRETEVNFIKQSLNYWLRHKERVDMSHEDVRRHIDLPLTETKGRDLRDLRERCRDKEYEMENLIFEIGRLQGQIDTKLKPQLETLLTDMFRPAFATLTRLDVRMRNLLGLVSRCKRALDAGAGGSHKKRKKNRPCEDEYPVLVLQ